jgi:hypothetical protein
MKLIPKESFIDIVSNKTVCFYKDKYGVEWMSIYPYYPFKFRTKSIKNKLATINKTILVKPTK